MPTLYGPKFWTEADFGQVADYESTEAFGGNAPIPGHPELWWFENLMRAEGAGPTGQHVIDKFTPGGGDYGVTGCILVPGRAGTLPHYQFDCWQDGQGIVIEWWQKLSTESFAEDVFGNGLILSNGGIGGDDDSSAFSLAFLHLETIEGDLQSAPAFQWWFRIMRWDDGFQYNDAPVDDVADDAWHNMQIILKPGTIVGAFTNVQADGSYAVYKDATPGVPGTGTLLFSRQNIPITINDWATGAPDGYYMRALWHGYFDMLGPVTGTWIYTGSVDMADVCGCTSVPPGTVADGGGTGHGAIPVQTPTIGTQIACVGNGTVPTQASLTFAENWWGA